jgi:hypothetical protein
MFAKIDIANRNLVGDRPMSVCPVRFGVPFPVGTSEEHLANMEIVSRGQAIAQSSILPLSHRGDGSVQWASVEVLADLSNSDPLFLLPKEKSFDFGNTQPYSSSISVQSVDGALQFQIQDPEDKNSIHTLNACLEVSGDWGTARVSLVPLSPASGESSDFRISFISAASASFRIGQLPQAIDFHLELKFWRTGHIDMALRLCNPNPAGHRGGNWDLGNKGSIYIDDLTLKLFLQSSDCCKKLLIRESPSSPVKQASHSIELFQASSGGVNWNCSNHYDRTRMIPMPFRGYRLHVDENESVGERSTPFVAIESDETTLGVAHKRFWQNFPLSIRARNNKIEIGFFPKECGYEHELQGGEQKTFELAAYLGRAPADSMPLDGFLSEPYPVFGREYLERMGVLNEKSIGSFGDEIDSLYDGLVQQAVEGVNSFFAKRERIDEYGWRSYGDVYGDHESVHHRGATPLISHNNNQYDCVLGFFYQFMRSGDHRWYEQMIAMANHAWDIDTYHTKFDKLLYNGGLFWHTYHYADADTGTHRSYPRSLLSEEHFESGRDLESLGKTGRKLKKVYGKGGGPAASHNYSTGWMYVYYLTGHNRYREAALNAADYVLGLEDGSKTPFRWLTRSATGHASCSSHGYYGPGRASANSTLSLLTGFELTRERRYLDMAILLMKRTVHPEQDLEQLDLLNAELRWFYTMYLQALCRLIDVLESLPGEMENLQYAVASLLHYARWMVKNERPILDAPEKLQYPTETWAAQDIRKWHVLAYAARWCSSLSEGRTMMDKAEWFYDYVMRTLDGFETKFLCRPVVLLLNYGWQRKGLLQAFNEKGLRRIELPDQWPPHIKFRPQREIAIQRGKRVALSVATFSVVIVALGAWWIARNYFVP